MPFCSDLKVTDADTDGAGGGAVTGAGSDLDGVGDNGRGSPLRIHVRWICQLVSEKRALSC